MKMYRIIRKEDGSVQCIVYDDENNTTTYPLKHIKIHSPTGFECGYPDLLGKLNTGQIAILAEQLAKAYREGHAEALVVKDEQS